VKDGSTDVGTSEGVKGCPALAAVELGRTDEPQQANLEQILPGFSALAGVVEGERAYQLSVLLHKVIAYSQRLAGWSPVPAGMQ
jgi:hypothetical protein